MMFGSRSEERDNEFDDKSNMCVWMQTQNEGKNVDEDDEVEIN